MTLIVGAICKDAIVVGAESETTRGIAKYQGTKKITIVNFMNGQAIIGEAGVAFLSGALVDAFNFIASNSTIENALTVPRVLETAFRGLSQRTIAPPLGTPECQDFYRQDINNFELTVAFYLGEQPHLYAFSPVFGIALECHRGFSTSGIGGDLAEFLLQDFKFEELDSKGASLAVAYVAQQVKRSVSGCGGNTEIAVVSKDRKPEKWSAEIVQLMDASIRRMTDDGHKMRMDSVSKMLNEETLAQYHDLYQ